MKINATAPANTVPQAKAVMVSGTSLSLFQAVVDKCTQDRRFAKLRSSQRDTDTELSTAL